MARVLNLLTTRSSEGGKVKLSFDVVRKLSALLDNFSSLLSRGKRRRECLPTAFDQMATIIHFMYDNIQFAEKELEIETFHLKLVKLLLALKCFDIASEQARCTATSTGWNGLRRTVQFAVPMPKRLKELHADILHLSSDVG